MEEQITEIIDETNESTNEVSSEINESANNMESEQTDEIQTVFNTDPIDILVEEGEVENVYTTEE